MVDIDRKSIVFQVGLPGPYLCFSSRALTTPGRVWPWTPGTPPVRDSSRASSTSTSKLSRPTGSGVSTGGSSSHALAYSSTGGSTSDYTTHSNRSYLAKTQSGYTHSSWDGSSLSHQVSPFYLPLRKTNLRVAVSLNSIRHKSYFFHRVDCLSHRHLEA